MAETGLSKNKSGSQSMSHAGIQWLGGWVLRHAQDLVAADAGQAPRAVDQEEAGGSLAPKRIGIGPFPGAWLGRAQGLELEAAREVVREDAEPLPRAVGPVVVRGDHVQGEPPP